VTPSNRWNHINNPCHFAGLGSARSSPRKVANDAPPSQQKSVRGAPVSQRITVRGALASQRIKQSIDRMEQKSQKKNQGHEQLEE